MFAAKPDPRSKETLAERERIAQDLRETLLSFLSVSAQMHAAVDHLPAESAARPRFSRALQAMDRALEEGGRAVRGLHFSQDQVPSLGHALASVPHELGLPTKVGFRVVVAGQPRELKTGLFEELYRIGREAILNAYRHSGATQIETEIEYCAKELRIAVRDNGCGIDLQVLEQGRHWGLLGMREREERIGGRLRLLSRAALGTEVELSIPSRLAFEERETRAAG